MNTFLIVLSIIVILIILFFWIVIDAKLLFWYMVDKKNIKYRLIRVFRKDDQEIFLLGSLHHMHKNLPDFGFQHLKAVLLNINPDVLLIESRQGIKWR